MVTSQKTIELAGKIYKYRSENGLSIQRLMSAFHVSSYEVEDALAYLVQSGFMSKSWKVGSWTYNKHRQNRPRGEKAQQELLFPTNDKPKRRSKVIELEVSTRISPIDILRGQIIQGLVDSGWIVGKWKTVKDQVERTDGRQRILVTLWREEDHEEEPQEAKQISS